MAIDKSTDQHEYANPADAAGLTLLTARDQLDLEQTLGPIAGIQDLSRSSPQVPHGQETPLNVPKWVWVLPLLTMKVSFLAFLAGVPLLAAVFFGLAPIALIPLLIFLVYCAAGAGAAVQGWITKSCKEGR